MLLFVVLFRLSKNPRIAAPVDFQTLRVHTVGGRTSARRNPTGTIIGNQAIKQEANAYVNIKQ